MERSFGSLEEGYQGILRERIAGLSENPPGLLTIPGKREELAIFEKEFSVPSQGRKGLSTIESYLRALPLSDERVEGALRPREMMGRHR